MGSVGFRTLSNSSLDEYIKFLTKYRKSSPDKPFHKNADSLLSSESGFTNFRGLINWGLILLFIFGFRMALDNLHTRGILIDPFLWRTVIQSDTMKYSAFIYLGCVNIFILVAFGIEVFLSRYPLPNLIVYLLVTINLIGCICFPTVAILTHDWSPFFSSPMIMLYIVIFLKLWSYAVVNSWCRASVSEGRPSQTATTLNHKPSVEIRKFSNDVLDCKALHAVISQPRSNADLQVSSNFVARSFGLQAYPDNLNLTDLYYFMLAPTLCYEINFPRTFTIRKNFVIKCFLEFVFLLQLIVCLVQQWMMPALKGSVTPFIRSRWSYILERLLVIAIPNHIIWLICFYATYQSYFNLLAELMRFGDRTFYKDWWNAPSVGEFWSTWNIPVHRWAGRHIYYPLMKRGLSPFMARAFVYLVSALFHELMVSVPLKMFRMWAFFGMFGQLPYVHITMIICQGRTDKLGNFFMWIILIAGQPLALYMYFHDYYVQHYN